MHAARHRYSTALHNAGIPDNVIKEIIGWTSLEMVAVYVDSSADDEIGKYFGEDGIKKVEVKSLEQL